MLIVEEVEQPGYEQVALFTDAEAGLKAIVAIHDISLGPACGGVRIWPYTGEEEALRDVLSLARAMTYKAAVAGLDIGGGKAVVIADPHTEVTEALLRAFGRCLNVLGGRFLTTADVGGTGWQMEIVSEESDHVVGLPESKGGSGDSSIMSGLGVYVGMKACAKAVWGRDSLRGPAGGDARLRQGGHPDRPPPAGRRRPCGCDRTTRDHPGEGPGDGRRRGGARGDLRRGL